MPTESPHLPSFYDEVRAQTETLCRPLSPEDMQVQSMPQASPAKWHLAHTTWFFETFILAELPDFRPFHAQFTYLFNSYYNAVGDRVARPSRGLMSRPSATEVFAYRHHVDERMRRLLRSPEATPRLRERVLLGLHHEQQHQELLLTDIKHALGANPLNPSYQDSPPSSAGPVEPLRWHTYPGGLVRIGHEGTGFAFDNETPRHQVFLNPYRLAGRLVSCGEFRAFLDDGGYERPGIWLSDGWDACRTQGWRAPLYWEERDGQWHHHTLFGFQPIQDSEPVTHISFYEADAYARWAGARLPTEVEWEVAASCCPEGGSFLESGHLHPAAAPREQERPVQMFGELWQWTASPYVAYPGYRPLEGALGEYNGKFMCNQFVLRGGSCVTPRSHFRPSYRNFFPADARWQFTGIRLAQDS